MYLPPNSFRKQDIFNPSVRFAIPKWGWTIPVTGSVFIPQMGHIYSLERVCIPQIQLMKLILRPGQSFAKWPAVIILAPRKLQWIIYNFKASFKTFHSAWVRPPSAYAVANWETPFTKSITKMKSEKITHLASKQCIDEAVIHQNSGWENYQHNTFATLADRTRREIFRHNTLELCRQR